MKIIRLKLRGAIGIRKGLGIEEIEIDFSKFQPGLIALTGRNGSGKTTIMENLHPYRQMVSRDGSLQSHFFLKDSFRILEFEYNGNHYESKILIDALTGGSEAYLICNGKPLNDGKLTTYDKAIEEILGSPELFFNSVFSGQKSKGIAELKPADRRKLFYELLNLNSYEIYLERAKEELKKNELKLSEIEGTIKALTDKSLNIDDLLVRRSVIDKEHLANIEKANNLETEIEAVENKIREIEMELHSGKEKLKANEELEAKAVYLETDIRNLTTAHNSKMSSLNDEIDDNKKLIERYEKVSENIETIDANLKKIEQLSENLRTLQNKKANLQQMKSEIQNTHALDLDSINKNERDLTNRQKDLDLRESEINSLTKEIERAETESVTINEVPCNEEVGKSCKFLINAYKNKAEIPQLKEKLTSLINEFETKKISVFEDYKKFNYLKQMIDENYKIKIDELLKDIAVIDKEIKSIDFDLTALNKSDWKKLKSEADSAAINIRLCEERISSIQKQREELANHFNDQVERITKEITELNSKIDLRIEDKLIELNSSRQVNTNKLNDLKLALNKMNEQISVNKTELAKINQQIKDAEAAQRKIDELNSLKTFIELEIKDWNFLCKAFDKTGIPVLKLENSGIEITTIANELLSLFENKFRIVFETTSLTKDKKKMKETFDINIIEEDGVCEIGNKSGGQQVWLETAIQLSIMILLSQQGKKYETAFLDEKDGALDLDNAYAYIEMIKKAHQMSGVYNTFIITHRTELLDYIPQQIKLNNGILEIMN